MILLILSFVAGILTILAPCTLPLLPIIVGSAIAGEEKANFKKALTIAIALGVSIILFTLLLKVSTLFINIPQEVWAIISGTIILIYGLISVFPNLWENLPFVSKMNVGSNRMLAKGYKRKNLWGDIIIGAALGPVFSTCSPTYFVILATVLPQSLALGLIDLFAYAVGLSGSLLVIAFVGQKVVNKIGGLSDTHGWFKRGLGVIFILLGLAIMCGFDKTVEAKLLSSGSVFDITQVEQYLLQFNENHKMAQPQESTEVVVPSVSTTTTVAVQIKHPIILSHGPKAPEIVDPSGFINTDGKPITIAQFKGKNVVLLDVWTYSCINCQRTLPYVTTWYEKYKDQGLVVIGLHTPEFSFEKVQTNVADAVKRFGITYPVVMDNDYATWNAYGNQYWPRKYLINVNGEIIYDHIGEGNYDETERQIQKALLELKAVTDASTTVSMTISRPVNVVAYDSSKVNSPETYFGSGRNEYLANGMPQVAGLQTLTIPQSTQSNQLYLEGSWDFKSEYAQSISAAARVLYKYSAKNVYMVASSDAGVKLKILRDGQPIGAVAGSDVAADGTVTIKENRLYNLVKEAGYGQHTLEIEIEGPGLKAFTFTFG